MVGNLPCQHLREPIKNRRNVPQNNVPRKVPVWILIGRENMTVTWPRC